MLVRFGNYLYLCGIALAHEWFQHQLMPVGDGRSYFMRRTFSILEQTPTPFLYHKLMRPF
jgi:hypothetical protein